MLPGRGRCGAFERPRSTRTPTPDSPWRSRAAPAARPTRAAPSRSAKSPSQQQFWPWGGNTRDTSWRRRRRGAGRGGLRRSRRYNRGLRPRRLIVLRKLRTSRPRRRPGRYGHLGRRPRAIHADSLLLRRRCATGRALARQKSGAAMARRRAHRRDDRIERQGLIGVDERRGLESATAPTIEAAGGPSKTTPEQLRTAGIRALPPRATRVPGDAGGGDSGTLCRKPSRRRRLERETRRRRCSRTARHLARARATRPGRAIEGTTWP